MCAEPVVFRDLCLRSLGGIQVNLTGHPNGQFRIVLHHRAFMAVFRGRPESELKP